MGLKGSGKVGEGSERKGRWGEDLEEEEKSGKQIRDGMQFGDVPSHRREWNKWNHVI